MTPLRRGITARTFVKTLHKEGFELKACPWQPPRLPASGWSSRHGLLSSSQRYVSGRNPQGDDRGRRLERSEATRSEFGGLTDSRCGLSQFNRLSMRAGLPTRPRGQDWLFHPFIVLVHLSNYEPEQSNRPRKDPGRMGPTGPIRPKPVPSNPGGDPACLPIGRRFRRPLLAEGVYHHFAGGRIGHGWRLGLDSRWNLRGTSTDEIGNPPHRGVCRD
jgi:hypothetical protein